MLLSLQVYINSNLFARTGAVPIGLFVALPVVICCIILFLPADMATILKASFNLKRETGYYLLNIYIPCSMLVGLSWVTFWLNREASAARVSLGKSGYQYLHTKKGDIKCGIRSEYEMVYK